MPRDDRPSVSIVIVNWNGRQHLQACLDALAAQQGVEFETLLVDNGSTDGSAEFVRDAVSRRCGWSRLPENRGFAGGNNAGRARGARPVSGVPQQRHRRPSRDGCAALRGGVDEPPGFALATSRVVYMHDPAVIDSAGDGVLRWGGAFKRFHGAPRASGASRGEVFGVCGAACLMPKAVFDELGGFDEDFFVSHEDVDLSYRARLLGYRCRYVGRRRGAASRQRHARDGQRVRRVPRPAQPGVDVSQEHAAAASCCERCRATCSTTPAAAGYFARMGLLGTFLRAKVAALAGVPRVLRQARGRCSATRARRRRRHLAAARAAVAGDEAAARSRSTSGWRGAVRDDARRT